MDRVSNVFEEGDNGSDLVLLVDSGSGKWSATVPGVRGVEFPDRRQAPLWST